MSRHIVTTSENEIVVGVDRPLNHVFASVFDVKGKNAGEVSKGFNPFSWFEPTPKGVDAAIKAVEDFSSKKMPENMKQALLDDLDSMVRGENLNRVAYYKPV